MSYLALLKEAEERLKRDPGAGAIQSERTGAGTEPQATSPEILVASVLAETKPDEVGQILTVWEELFGLRLDRQRVSNHLKALRQWQSQWVRKG